MKNWIKKTFLADFIGVFRSVRSMRRDGSRGPLMIMQEDDYQGILAEEKRWTAIREAEKELAIRCVEHMIKGGKACMYCEERKNCMTSKLAANKRGYEQWWLRYLTSKLAANKRGYEQWWLRYLTEKEQAGQQEHAK